MKLATVPGGGRDGRLFGFHELIAHAAATRDLCAGTIIGSGTVSNSDYGRVRIEVRQKGGVSVFGAIDQAVVNHSTGRTGRNKQ